MPLIKQPHYRDMHVNNRRIFDSMIAVVLMHDASMPAQNCGCAIEKF